MNIFLPEFTPFQTILLILILIPTLITLIGGAPWVPTPSNRVKKMLALAKIKRGQTVCDLGCGDGRLVHEASIKYGANAIGFEFSPLIFCWAKILQPIYRLRGSRAKIKFKNFYKADLSNADAIFCYLLPHAMKKVQKKCERELKRGARLVSYAFPILDWTPKHRERRQRKNQYGPIWVYQIKSREAKGTRAKK